MKGRKEGREGRERGREVSGREGNSQWKEGRR